MPKAGFINLQQSIQTNAMGEAGIILIQNINKFRYIYEVPNML